MQRRFLSACLVSLLAGCASSTLDSTHDSAAEARTPSPSPSLASNRAAAAPAPRPGPSQDAIENTASQSEPKTSDSKQKPDEEVDLEALEDAARDLKMKIEPIRLRLHIAELKYANAMRDHAFDSELLMKKHERAMRELEAFGEKAQQRLESARIDLESSRDRVKNETEELEQLQLMYAGSELEDRTSEIVLNRGRRALELATRRLALSESKLATLQSTTIPLERQTKYEAQQLAARAAEQADFKAELLSVENDLSLLQLTNQLDSAQRNAARAHGKLMKAKSGGGK